MSSSVDSYEGERDYNGLFHGKGKLETNGIIYNGDFKDGAFDGNGEITLKNGSIYRAKYSAGVEIPGTGSLQWPDGLPYNIPEGGDKADKSAIKSSETWQYLHPFDRRFWFEHKEKIRADICYDTTTRKVQLSSTTLSVEEVGVNDLKTKVTISSK
jgi:hypothetical protein